MKQYLLSIVQGYGYKNVKEFLAELKASKAGYTDYQLAVAMWEQQTGKAESDSLKSRLQRKQQEVKERENNRQSTITGMKEVAGRNRLWRRRNGLYPWRGWIVSRKYGIFTLIMRVCQVMQNN